MLLNFINVCNFYFWPEYREFIPFTQPAPIDEEEAKKQKKKASKKE